MKKKLNLIKHSLFFRQQKYISRVESDFIQLQSYSMSGLPVLKKLYSLSQDIIDREIIGDFVECGVYNGGSAATVAKALCNSNRKIWLYDSFEGMPSPTEKDGTCPEKFASGRIGSVDKVFEALKIAKFPKTQTIIRQGWFNNTFKEPLPKQVAMLHVDCDWYESVLLTLETFYDHVSEGGIIVLDDFGHWEGTREAFYDFCFRRNLKPLLERCAHTQAFWIKGRTHNRSFNGKVEIP